MLIFNQDIKMKTKLLFAILISSCLTGCEKFLDEKPISGLVEANYYRNTDEVETGVIACYDGLQQVYDIEFKLTEIRADNTSGVSLEGDWGAIKFFRDSPLNFFLQDFWQRSYNTIARCNLVLRYLNNVSDPVKRNYFEGEARFIRSLMYFNLVRLYGDVPLITASMDFNDTEKFKRISKTEVYNQIKADLLKAIDLCPPTWTTAQGIARATKGASQALLGKVYITLQEWNNARLQFEPIVGANLKGSTHQLNPSYAAIFSTSSEMSKEIIFAVRYKAASNREGNSFSHEYTNNGDARNVRASAAYKAFFESTDVRAATTYNSTTSLAAKFLDPTAPQRDAGNDFPVIRFADVLLLYAEALNELSSVPTSATLAPINEVRKRANVPEYSLIQIPTKEAVRNAIYKERQLEFGFENQRWYDLLRMDRAMATSILNAYLAATGNPDITVPAYRFVFPIPQTEIDLSNGKLVQNPEYN